MSLTCRVEEDGQIVGALHGWKINQLLFEHAPPDVSQNSSLALDSFLVDIVSLTVQAIHVW